MGFEGDLGAYRLAAFAHGQGPAWPNAGLVGIDRPDRDQLRLSWGEYILSGLHSYGKL